MISVDNVNIAKLLIANGANVNAKGFNGRSPLVQAIGSGKRSFLFIVKIPYRIEKCANHSNSHWNTGAENVTQLLIDNGADLNIATDRGELPIHLAAEKGTSLSFFANLSIPFN